MVEVQFAETGQLKKAAGNCLKFIVLQVQFHHLIGENGGAGE